MDFTPLALVFLTGLTAGFGHCLGMCGGFVYAYSLKTAQALPDGRQPLFFQLRFHFLYHAGRIVTYVLLGGVIGYLGSALGLARFGTTSLRGAVPLAAGLLMVFMSLSAAFFQRAAPYQGLSVSGRLFGGLRRLLGGLIPSGRPWTTFPLGVMMGFLPCGFMALMEVKAAAAGSFLGGAAVMVAFGIGTVPALLALGMLSTTIGIRMRGYFLYAASALALILGIMTAVRGILFYVG